MLAFAGFMTLFIIMYVLFKNKATPVVVFILAPVVMAFVAGFSVEEVAGFVRQGINTTSPMAVLFIFSVTYFGIMSDNGMFNILIDKLTDRAGTNVVMIAIITALISIFTHFSGTTTNTVLIAVPSMLPLYKKLNIRPQLLLLIVGAGMGVMNALPWGGPVMRASTVLGIDPTQLWYKMIPIQILGIIATLGIAVVGALREIKYHGAGVVLEGVYDTKSEDNTNELRRPNLIWFNILLTISLLVVLLSGAFPTYFVFMIGSSIALVVNYPSPKAQKQRLKSYAPSALDVTSVVLGAGVLVGILGNSGMLEAMAVPLLKILPSFIARYLNILMGVLALPLGLVLGTDSYFYILMPLAIEIGKSYDITALQMAISMLIGKNLSLFISPLIPATFLGIGFVGIDLKDQIKSSFLGLYATSLLMLLFALITGMV